MTKIILLDNGSLRAAATLTLRRLAAELSERAGQPVDAVSLQHANNIDASELNGEPAWILQDYLRAQLSSGCRQFLLLPLFFGLSRAITSLVPDIEKQLTAEFGAFQLSIADVLYPLPAGDSRLSQILFDNCRSEFVDAAQPSSIVLVDHGSPSPRVTEVRQRVADELQGLVGADTVVEQAVMERRKGREYDFNGALLEDWLRARAESGEQSVLVCLMFLLPGRHAGAGGDITGICQHAMQQHPGFSVHITPLISDNPGLIELLQQRLSAGLERRPGEDLSA